jgi:DNA-binding response OmpR family regulator
MYKILIIEDEPNMLEGLKDNFEFEGYEVFTASDGETGLSNLMANAFDLVILDVMLPLMNGFDVCKQARKCGVKTPVIFLTAKGEEMDKVRGLELGADDYVTKPFSLRELLARAKSILRRTAGIQKNEAQSNFNQIGKLSVNFQSNEAFIESEPVKLSFKEFELLQFLYENSNRVLQRDEILDKVWGLDSNVNTRTLDNFIVRLRQKIEINPEQPRIILTVHGAGYKFVG